MGGPRDYHTLLSKGRQKKTYDMVWSVKKKYDIKQKKTHRHRKQN